MTRIAMRCASHQYSARRCTMHHGRTRRSVLIVMAILLGVLAVAGVRISRNPLGAYQWLYETTDGRFTWLGGLPVLLLRTTGRKSGEERTAALVYLQDGNTFVIVASRGGSNHPPRWLLNLQDHPEVGVQI